MQTSFSLAQLADPDISEAEKILRACVHCGFCTATCPTYVLLGDELDSPRGRIYLIKDMLEQDRPATGDVVKHIDRCLSCLSCMTTCPSGVHYMHLVDHARVHVEETYRRPLVDRALRALLATVLPHPLLLAWSLRAARLARPLAPLLAALGWSRPAAMLRLAPKPVATKPGPARRVFKAQGMRRGRVAILDGCANPVLGPSINAAAIRLLTRHGIEVVIAADEGCCGALVHHMGREGTALRQARNNVDAWWRERDGEGLDAILVTASGCGTTLKDYGFMLRTDSAYADKAAAISALVRDVSEYLASTDLAAAAEAAGRPAHAARLRVAYHAACSLQHGQKITRTPKTLLASVGFAVQDIPEGHLCCGSAGVYNMLQPDIAQRLAARKAANIARVKPDVVATGNLGCMVQIRDATATPVVHVVELIDWATGGPKPEALQNLAAAPALSRAHADQTESACQRT
jgi:glycolate dehydrogenase iron-sulfur subunit